MKIAFLVCVALVTGALPALGQQHQHAQQQQQPVLGSSFEQRFDELAQWLSDYYAWEEWFEVWGNRVAKNFDGQLILERKKRPDPPVWLAAECQGYLGSDGLLATGCDILRHWDEDPLLILQRRRPSVVRSGGRLNDTVAKTSFFHRVHLTGLWTQARYPGTQAYGIAGMQIGVFETGRFTLPAVGVMVVLVADGEGGYDWKPATTVGFGYRLFDFVPPFMDGPVSIHLNLARTNVHGVQDARIPLGMQNVNLFGLSVSPRRRR